MSALALALLVPSLYAGIYYALYQTLPFVPQEGMSTAILANGPKRRVLPRATNAVAARRLASAHMSRVVARTYIGESPEELARAGATSGPMHMLAGSGSERRARVVASSSGASVTPNADPVVQPGTLRDGTIVSQLFPGNHPYMIYLPPGYDAGDARYPVLYLLHGAPGSYDDWVRVGGIDKTLDAMIAVARIPPLIVVMPDGNGGYFGDTEWANSADGRVRAEDYLVQDVVGTVDSRYRTIADRAHRAIGGLSTGGFGAVNLTLHHPNVFGYALSLSGNYLAAKTWTRRDMWAGNKAAKAYNSPLLFAWHTTSMQSLHFYLTTGTSDKADSTYRETRQFSALLEELGVPHRAEYFGGRHTWSFWRVHIVDALDYLASAMRPA